MHPASSLARQPAADHTLSMGRIRSLELQQSVARHRRPIRDRRRSGRALRTSARAAVARRSSR